MSTLTRLAGIQDTSRSGANTPQPPPIPSTDPESQTQHSITPRPSRASIPLDRRPSRKSIASVKSRSSLGPAPTRDLPPLPPNPADAGASSGPHRTNGGIAYTATKSSLADQDTGAAAAPPGHRASDDFDEEGEGDDDDDEAEIPWGPAHPCFPHPNPYVARSDPAHAATRVIRVQRDWLAAGDAYPAFQNVYPEILAEWVSEAQFRALVEGINGRLREAFRPDSARAVVDALLGAVTGFVWDDLGMTGVKKGVKGLEEWMEGWNREREAERVEVRLVPLRRTGYLNLDIVIPDPGIDVGPEEEEDGRR